MIPMTCQCVYLWPQQAILSTTVNIFRVVITKGTMCCLNCLTSRQMKICPTKQSSPVSTRSIRQSLWEMMNSSQGMKWPVATRNTRVKMVVHLLTSAMSTVGWGLNLYFTTAWKSGRKPSAKSDTIISTMPSTSVQCSSADWLGSQALKTIMPRVTSTATTMRLLPSLSAVSFTPLNSTPTKATERMLQERIIITTGQLVRCIAQVYAIVEMTTADPHFMP